MAKKETVLSVVKEIRDVIVTNSTLNKIVKGAADLKKGQMLDLKEGELLAMLKSPDRVIKLSDGWVKDRLLGIDWGPTAEKRMNWEAGMKHCADLKGRLPHRSELIMLNLLDPETTKDMFPDMQSDYYWSGTTLASGTSYAWVVDFVSGDVYSDKTGGYYVRPVRSSQ